jgi:hypothetical protein
MNTLLSGVRCVRSRKFWELDLDDFVTDGVPDQIGDRVTIEKPQGNSNALFALPWANNFRISRCRGVIRLAPGSVEVGFLRFFK